MPGNVTDNDADFTLLMIAHFQVIIVITAGALTINALTGNIQSGNLGSTSVKNFAELLLPVQGIGAFYHALSGQRSFH